MQLENSLRLNAASPQQASYIRSLLWAIALLSMLLVAFESTSHNTSINSNEDVYLIRAKQLLDSSFLENDWLFGRDSIGRSAAKIPYDFGLAALWSLTDSGPIIAIIGRICAWLALSIAFLSLVRTLGLSPLIGFTAWLIWFKYGQSLGAGEWLWGSVESKCFAYAAVFLGLKLALDRRFFAAGVIVGIACWLHVLVGGWSAAFISIGLLLALGLHGLKDLTRFMLPCAVLGIGSIAYFFVSSGMGDKPPSNTGFDLSYVNVVLRNPHHLYPPAFDGKRLYILLALLPVAVLAFSPRLWTTQTSKLLSGVMLAATATYVAGIVCGYMGVLKPLVYYPFRVGDALIPLLGTLVVVAFFSTYVSSHLNKRSPRFKKIAFTLSLLLIFGTVLGRYGPESTGLIQDWKAFALSTDKKRVQLAYPDHFLWLRENTPPSDIVFMAPCVKYAFVGTRRANVVSFKSSPVSARAEQWYERLTASNGGPIKATGAANVCEELSHNFASLNAKQLRKIRDDYQANWYVVYKERPDLGLTGTFATDSWIYNLAEL